MARLGYLLALGFSCSTAFWIAHKAWSKRDTTGATSLTVMAAATGLWAGTTVGLTLSPPAGRLLWLQASYLGMIAAPISFFTLSLEYTGRARYLTPAALGGLLGLGGLFLGLVWTNPLHELYWADVQYSSALAARITTTPGPAFWGFVAFTYVLLTAGSVLFLRYTATAPHLYRSQTIALLLAVAAPWVVNVPHAFQLITVDVTPVALSVTAVALWTATSRYRLTDLGPIALRTVFENISSGVIVVDRDDRVVDLNAVGQEMLGTTDGVIGTPLRTLLSPPIYDRVQALTDEAEIVEVPPSSSPSESTSETSYYSIRITPIETHRDTQKGRLLVLEDVTDDQRRRRQLERQNKKLKEFASVVSHDLRNPLNVALGNLGLARENHDSEFLDRSETALHRMQTLIDDLLALAQAGLEITDPEPVALEAAVSEAWAAVDTNRATLRNQTSSTILADRSRLRQLTENLIRNAIEHGGENVTVTVADHDDGFYVADDGPGISSEQRNRVFDAGYSTNEAGTGFGLNIVKEIANAHDWRLHLRDSADGGLHVDVTGVRLPE